MRLRYKKYELNIEFKVGEGGLDCRRCKFLPYVELTTDKHYYNLREHFKYWVCFGWLSCKIQKHLHSKKIFWHNFVMNQCTPYFECCMHKVRDEDLDILKQICYAGDEQIPTVHISKRS